MTDRTPHESLPLKPGQYRQYFRLVTSNVSVWYAKHSTPNPLGCTPGEGVRIVYETLSPHATSDLSNTRKSKSELASAHGEQASSSASWFGSRNDVSCHATRFYCDDLYA